MPRALCALAMTGFTWGGGAKRAVGDAGPYGCVTRSADGRADVGIGPYGGVTRGAAKRPVGEIGEALPVAEEARRF